MFKRALVAASVFAAFAVPAMAEVTVYGSMRASIEASNGSYTDSKTNKTSDLNQVRLVDEKSRIGFKGTDKLDNGLSVFWKAESRIKVNGGSTFGSRDQIIGLSGDKLGTFTFGNTTDAYSDATYLTPVLDNAWGISDDSNMYQQGTSGNRTPTIKYDSPEYFGGLKYSLSYGDFSNKTSAANRSAYAGAVNYTTSLFNVGAAALQYNDATVSDYTVTTLSGTKSRSFLIGAGLTPMPGWTFSAHAERQKNKFLNGDQYQDDFGVGAGYEVGKWAFRGMFYVRTDLKGDGAYAVSDSGAQHLLATAKYDLSKQTSVLVAANYLKTQKNTTGESLGLANGVYAKADDSATAISIGLKTNF